MKGKHHLTFESENLAVPDILTGWKESEDNEEETDSMKPEVHMENVAVPEIQFKKKKNKTQTD